MAVLPYKAAQEGNVSLPKPKTRNYFMKHWAILLVTLAVFACGKENKKAKDAPPATEPTSEPQPAPSGDRGPVSVSREELTKSIKTDCESSMEGVADDKKSEFCGCVATSMVDAFAKKCGQTDDMITTCELSEEESNVATDHCSAILQ
jgi:hypothetical protein